MGHSLVRVSTRAKAVWDAPTLENLSDIEFRSEDGSGVQLNPSFYFLEWSSEEDKKNLLIKIATEHIASFLSPPKLTNYAVDCIGIADEKAVFSPGTTSFRFTREIHRELKFHSECDMKAFLEEVLASCNSRRHLITKKEILSFAAEMIKVTLDAEWLAFVSAPEKAEWKRVIEKFNP